jgi:hypothetical protein
MSKGACGQDEAIAGALIAGVGDPHGARELTDDIRTHRPMRCPTFALNDPGEATTIHGVEINSPVAIAVGGLMNHSHPATSQKAGTVLFELKPSGPRPLRRSVERIEDHLRRWTTSVYPYFFCHCAHTSFVRANESEAFG